MLSFRSHQFYFESKVNCLNAAIILGQHLMLENSGSTGTRGSRLRLIAHVIFNCHIVIKSNVL